jgi:hypothetical protein
VAAAAFVFLSASVAGAQVINSPTYKPVENKGGWVYQAAWLLFVLAALVVLLVVVGYMMRAPRFASDEEGSREVRADRVRPGKELPRRSVDVSQAVPVVVAPPVIPTAAPEPATVGAPAPAAAAPAAAAPAAAAPAAAPAPAATPAPAAADPVATPADAPAPPAAEAEAPPAAPAAPAERVEVSLDQETFDATLAELLAKGTDRRVAEGQARRAAMIAARKKAGGA